MYGYDRKFVGYERKKVYKRGDFKVRLGGIQKGVECSMRGGRIFEKVVGLGENLGVYRVDKYLQM